MLKAAKIGRTYYRAATSVTALDQVSFELEHGDYLAITGPSGSGKTTLLHIMGLLDSDFSGNLFFDSTDIHNLTLPERAHLRLAKMGFIFQSYNLLDGLDILSNVALPHWRLFGNRKLAQRRAESLLERVGLTDRRHHKPKELSTGEMQRTAFVRALINEPVVLMADEPTGALDADNAQLLMRLLGKAHEEGKTVVVVSHNPSVANSAQRTIVLNHGRIVNNGYQKKDAEAE